MKDSDENVQISTCQRDSEHHCLTCSDEMIPVRVVHIDQNAGVASVVGTAPCACPPRHMAHGNLLGSYVPPIDGQAQGKGASPLPTPTEGARPHEPLAVEEIDITLIEDVAVGDLLLIHGGVALARL